jgi:hypothetical protein
MNHHDQALAAVEANDPEVRQGQVWRLRDEFISRPSAEYPMRLRVICRYPFTEPGDGRLWVVEADAGYSGRIFRMTEIMLRDAYDLHDDVEAD